MGGSEQWGRTWGPARICIGPSTVQFVHKSGIGLSNQVAKFVDDTQLFRMVKIEVHCEVLKTNLSMLGEWPPKWKMGFDVCKSKVMHTEAKILTSQIH